MSYQRPTLQELYKRVYGDLVSKSGVKSSVLAKSFLKAIAYAIAGVGHLLFGYLDYIIAQAFPTTCNETFLNVWGYVYGVSRKQATYATRKISLTGIAGSVISAQKKLKNNDDVEYETQSEVTISSGGSVEVLVQCVTSGIGGNIEVGDELSFSSPVVGVDSGATVVSSVDAIDGEDQEDLEKWRSRVILRIQETPCGGNQADYKAWALEIAGVTRAWVYPKYLGAGTVVLAFVNDAATDIFPDAAKVLEVQGIIDELRPVTAELFVFAPIKDEIPFEIQISPNTSAVHSAITSALKDLFSEECEPGGTLLLSHINEAISLAVGENDHKLISPTANIISAKGHLATVGSISFDLIT